MRTISRRPWWAPAGLGLVLLAATGCQTWVPIPGLTLPSPHYLQHPPQYIPPGPAYPVENELAGQMEANLGEPILPNPAPGPGPGGGAPLGPPLR